MDYFDGLVASKLLGSSSSSKVTKPYVEYTVNARNEIISAKLYADVMPNRIFVLSSVISVDLSENTSLTSISQDAFNGCSQLTTVAFPEGLTSIGYQAFSNCTSLKLTELPSTLTTIANYAFSNCRNITLSEIPSGVTSIGGTAFQSCIALTSMKLPPNVLHFPSSVFVNCTNLASVTFTNARAPYIDYGFFYNCSNLLDIYVPWAEGEVNYAPWGASNATIHYNWTEA